MGWGCWGGQGTAGPPALDTPAHWRAAGMTGPTQPLSFWGAQHIPPFLYLSYLPHSPGLFPVSEF